MTMINPEPIKLTPSESQTQFTLDYVEQIKSDRERIANLRDAYLERAYKAEGIIRKIVQAINGDIKELGLTEDDSFPLDTLNDIFKAEGLELSFKRTYEVLVEYKIHAKFKVEAESEEDAISECESQGIDSIDFDMYAEEEWEEQERNVIEAIVEEA